MSGTLNYRSANGQSVAQVGGKDGALAIYEAAQREWIAEIPNVSSTPTAIKNLDAGASQFVAGARVTAGAGDDTVASTRLSNCFPVTWLVPLGGVHIIMPSTAVSRVDVVGMGSVTATDGGVMAHDGDAADALAEMTTFEFSTPVDMVVITVSSSWNAASEAQATVEGYRDDNA